MFGFDPPKVIASEVFATLPEKYQTLGRGPRNPTRHSATGTTLEGPAFDRAGNLYITDIPNGRIFRISPDGGAVDLIAEYEGRPNGLKIHRDGRMFIADHHHGLMLLDPATGEVDLFVGGPENEHFKGVNDLTFASNGDLYFTDQGSTGVHDPSGRVYRLDAAGGLHCIIDTVPSPNGIVLHANEKLLYVAVTRTNQVWRVPMTRNGGVTKAGVFVQLPCPAPDGMAMDVDGNLAVAAPGLGVVWVFDSFGIPTHKIESCRGRFLTNIAFGGPDNQWLYMTEGDSYSVLRARLPRPGRLLYSHA